MSKLMIRVHDVESNEVIDREMTVSEIAEYEAAQVTLMEKKSEIEAKSAAKAALLDRLGMTEDEAKLLLA